MNFYFHNKSIFQFIVNKTNCSVIVKIKNLQVK